MAIGGKLNLQDGAGSHTVSLKAQDAALDANVEWTLPSADGTAGQVLATDGSGVLSWASGGSGDISVDVTLSSAAESVEVLPAPPSGKYYHITQIDAAANVNATPLAGGELIVGGVSAPAALVTATTNEMMTISTGESTVYKNTINANLNRLSWLLKGNITDQTQNKISLSLDGSGNTYIAYNYSNTPKVKKFVGGSWELLGSLTDQMSPFSYLSLALDSAGVPYIAYEDNNTLKIKTFDGAMWTDVGFDNIQGANVTIALDSSGVPYIAYNNPFNYQVNVKKFYTGMWIDVGSQTDQAQVIAIALDSSGVPYIAYNASNFLYVKKFDGAVWTDVGSLNESIASQPVSLALDSSGNPSIAYISDVNIVKVKKFDGAIWTDVGSISDVTYSFVSVALDSSGNPSIAYTSTTDIAKVKKFDGAVWTDVGSLSDVTASSNSNTITLILDSSGNPYIAYNANANLIVKNYELSSTDTTYPVRVYYKVLDLLN